MGDVFPQIILPQLSTLATTPPLGDDWLHEIKYDGYRLLCRKNGSTVDFFTRRGNRWSEKFPAIGDSVNNIYADKLWFDGELVVMKDTGHSCFGSLQQAVWRKDQGCLAYYVSTAIEN